MRCPKCGGDTYVTSTYNNVDNRIRRRRECDDCGYRFSTKEEEHQFVKPGEESPEQEEIQDEQE